MTDVSVPAAAPWWVLAVLTVIGVVVYLVARRDLRILNSMSALLTEGRHADVLTHRLPSPSNRRMGEAVQASSAVLTGRFALALELLGASSRPVRGFQDRNVVRMLRGAACWVTCGCAGGTPRTARPWCATQKMYAALDDAGVDVDEAICSVLLGRARLREGHRADALSLLEAGLAGLARRTDNAADLSSVHALLAEAQAGMGNAQASADHLAAATDQALRCGSPALDAEVARATGMVAVHQDRNEDARKALRDAVLRYEALGALPEAAVVREELGRLDA